MKNRELNFVPLRRGVVVPHGKYSFSLCLVSLPLFIAQGSLNSAIFLSKYRSCKSPFCNDPAVTVAAIKKLAPN